MKPSSVFLGALGLLQALSISATGSESQPTASRIEGNWIGSLHPSPAVELRIAIDIASANPGEIEAVMRSLDQGNRPIPITTLTNRGDMIHFEASRIGGTFDGEITADGGEIAGEWKQGAAAFPLIFKRVDTPAGIARPQEPKKPYPYREEEVLVRNGPSGVVLSGTLTLPTTAGRHAAVVLITGSGPQDRDETVWGHRPFLVLADHLTRAGIAVLRCDDRGVGKSTGNFAAALDGDFVEDALAGITFLRTRSEIDPCRIGLVGHSEGGVVAPRAAAKSSDVAFIVLLAGVGLPIDEMLLRQSRDRALARGATETSVARITETHREIFAMLREQKDPSRIEAAVHKLIEARMASLGDGGKTNAEFSESFVDAQMMLMLSPWFRDILNYDPRPVLATVKCPVLAVCGEKDMQVAAKPNLNAIKDALARGGNLRAETIELPGLNHLFQQCRTGSPAEYNRIEETFSPAALKLIAEWIQQTAGKSSSDEKG